MLLERLETLVEHAVEGAFGLVLRGKIQPLEIARRLTREAEEQKIITLNRVYVPNRFVVGLHPSDMATLGPIATELEAEFQRFVGEWVIDRDYAVNGPIRVTLAEQGNAGRRRMRIETSLDDARAAEDAARKGLGLELQVAEEEQVGRLHVEEGPDAGRAFTLASQEVLVGQGVDCDIRLHDPDLPSRYARFSPEGKLWRVVELDGGPPLRINDEFQREGVLRDGDRIRMGETVARLDLAGWESKVSADAA